MYINYEFHRVRPKLFPSLWYVQRKPCTYLVSRLALSQNKPDELPIEPRHLEVPLGGLKTIPEPMVRLAQTVQLFCTETNTVSIWTETRFDTTQVT
jgi:hypothetical protein